MRLLRPLLLLPIVVVPGLLAACAANQQNQQPPPYPSAWPPPSAQASAWPQPSATASAQPLPTQQTTTGPSATILDPGTNAGAAGVIAALGAPGDIAPGMGKEGTPLAGNFTEGQVLEQVITIMPGRCYTFVAAGIGPQEIEVQLVAQTPIPAFQPMMGDTTSQANKVILGRGANCIKLALIPIAVPAKWVIKAKRGQGIIVAQAFSK